jgi:hypothetical protein
VEAVLDWWNEIPSTAWRKGYEQGYAVGTIVEAMKARGYEAEVVIWQRARNVVRSPQKGGTTVADPKTLTWAEFTAAKAKRGTRTSKYAGFVRDMKPKTVYDASALFPKQKTDTLRSAIYGQAKSLNRKVQGIIRDGHLFVALAE